MAPAFDEMTLADGANRPGYEGLRRWLEGTPIDLLSLRRAEAELLFRRIGITFAVYGETEGEERIIPFDIIPRILTRAEWTRLARGLEQRVQRPQSVPGGRLRPGKIIAEQVVPGRPRLSQSVLPAEMTGLKLAHDIYVHIAGIDIVRVDDHDFYVLEDNARTPSGVSYMLENREVMMRIFPDLVADHHIAPVENYPEELLATLKSVAPPPRPTIRRSRF